MDLTTLERMRAANHTGGNVVRAQYRDTPGEVTVTANGTVVMRSTADGVRSVWLRGYALVGAPMGVSAPLYNQLLVQFQNLNHINRFTDAGVQGYPLLVEGANTYHQYDTPRLLATCNNDYLKQLSLSVVRPTGETVDALGNPLYASLTLDLIMSTSPVQTDPALSMIRGQQLQDGALHY